MYALGATIITSQLPINKWYEYINDPTHADAICDGSECSADCQCTQNIAER